MRKISIALLALSFALAAPLASSNPAAFAPHNGCVYDAFHRASAPTPTTPVVGTLGFFAPWPGEPEPLPCKDIDTKGNPFTGMEWGSYADPCPPPPFVGAVPGAFCGPVKAPWQPASCSWLPVVNTVKTGLVIGWDRKPHDGFQNLFPSFQEPYVYGPYPQWQPAWTVTNPYNESARVIAFPTSLLEGKALAPGDVNLVSCV